MASRYDRREAGGPGAGSPCGDSSGRRVSAEVPILVSDDEDEGGDEEWEGYRNPKQYEKELVRRSARGPRLGDAREGSKWF